LKPATLTLLLLGSNDPWKAEKPSARPVKIRLDAPLILEASSELVKSVKKSSKEPYQMRLRLMNFVIPLLMTGQGSSEQCEEKVIFYV